ncbi:MAG: ABC transporter permease [Ruminiclostridium sp.]
MTIFSTVLKRLFKSKIRFILLMLCPFIFIGTFALQTHISATIGIVDNDNTTVSNGIYNLLKKTDGIKIIKVKEDEIYDLTASYVVDYSIIIDSGFEKTMLSGEEANIREYYIEEKQKLYFVKNSITNELDNYRLLAKAVNYDESKFESALENYSESKLTVYSNVQVMNKNSKTRYSLVFLIQFMLYMAVITTGLILEDKSNGTYYRTFFGPTSMKRYMLENLLAFFTTAVIQSLGIILALKVVFNLYLGTWPLALIGLFVIFSLVCIALGIFITSILKKPMHAYVAIAVITTPILMLGGCYFEFGMMPDIMIRIGQFIPTTWVMRTVDALLDGSITTNALLTNYGVLLLFAAVFFAVGLVKKVDISK